MLGEVALKPKNGEEPYETKLNAVRNPFFIMSAGMDKLEAALASTK